MKVAMVIQNSLRSLGGGELVCITTCLALQKLGYHVKLVTDRFEPDEVQAAFGMGEVLRKCEQINVPQLGRKMARFSAFPGILFAWMSRRFLEKQRADVVFVTRDPRRPDVLPEGPLFRFVYEIAQLRNFWEDYAVWLKLIYKNLYARSGQNTTFLALSPALMDEMKRQGFPNTELVYPSYGTRFRPRPKKNQVVYVTFLAPQKNVDDFFEIARRLPQYKFYLIGRDTARVNRIYGGYASRVLANKPSNVEYVETRIRQSPDLLEESKVYLHTSTEPGMSIAVMEALSAGCVPLAPRQGGGGDVIEAARVGFRYSGIDDAVRFIRTELDEADPEAAERDKRLSPEEISKKAEIFSPEAFQDRLRHVMEKRMSS
jgi:glycosyltransferase involved in cell wall biosynthesis